MSRSRHGARVDARRSKDELIEENESLRRRLGILGLMEGGERKGSLDPLTERLQQVYREAPIGLCYFDTDLRFLMINDWLAAINGLPVDDHLGRRISEILPDISEGVEAQLRQVLDTAEPVIGGTVDTETPAHPGRIRSFRHHYYAIKSEVGTVLGVSCVVEEITEHKRRELVLDQLATAIEGVSEMVALYDSDDRLVLCNRAFFELHREVQETIALGTTFEVIIRAIVAKGLISDAVGREEAWLHERLERHKNPRGQLEIARADRTWLLVDEQRLSDGGTINIGVDITKRKRAEEALHESEQQFRLMTDALPALISYVDSGERYRLNNTAYERWFGHSREQLCGRHVKDVLGRATYDAIKPHIDTVLSGEAVTYEGLLPYKDGGQRFVRASYIPNVAESGQVSGFFVLVEDITEHRRTEEALRRARDELEIRVEGRTAELRAANESLSRQITERKQAEAALRESEARLTTGAKIAKVGYWVWDEIEEKATYCSDEMAEICGVAAGRELASMLTSFERDLEFVHPDDRDRFAELVRESEALKTGYDTEYRIVRADGEVRHLRQILEPVLDAQGNLVRSNGITQDVTEQKRIEEAVRTRDAWLGAILENAPIEIVLKDTEGRIMAISQNVADILGLEANDFIGGTTADFLPDHIAAKYMATDRKVLETGRPLQQEIVEEIDGSTRYSLNANFPLRDESGEITGICSITSDITEVKQAEVRLRDAIESISEGFVLFDADERFILCNSNYRGFYPSIADILKPGTKIEDVVRGTFENGAIQGLGETVESWMEWRLAQFRTGQGTHEQHLSDGRWLLCSERRTPSGGIVSIRTDITKRKQVEEALRKSEERYRELFDESPAAIWEEDWSPIKQMLDDLARGGVKDWRGYFDSHRDQLKTAYDLANILEISHATIKLYRKESKEQLLGMSAAAVVIDEELDAFREIVLSFLAGQMTVDIEAKDTTGDGSEIIVRRRVVIPPRRRDTWSRVIYAIEDITERKRAEEALRESEEKFRAVLDHSPAKIHIKDLDGRYLLLNKTAEALFGMTDQEARGKTTHEIFPKERADAFIAHDRDVSETLEVVEHEEEWLQNDGEHTFLTVKFPILNAVGEAIAVGAIGTDITERKRLEQQHVHAEKMEALGVLAGGISHEFNNMLFAIIGLTESVANTLPEGGEARTSLEGVLDAGERAAGLVRQILAFSRQDEIRPQALNLQDILPEALKLVRATLPTTIEIRQSVDAACGPVLADPTQVHQILLNLASNAAYAMGEKGGVLDVRLDPVNAGKRLMARFPQLAPGPYARLSVRDTGSGIDERTLDRIFDPFFTTKDRDAGTGMGLAAVHGIVSSYRGVIDVSSKPGRGTTFEIYLPIWAGEGEEDPRGDATRLQARRASTG